MERNIPLDYYFLVWVFILFLFFIVVGVVEPLVWSNLLDLSL